MSVPRPAGRRRPRHGGRVARGPGGGAVRGLRACAVLLGPTAVSEAEEAGIYTTSLMLKAHPHSMLSEYIARLTVTITQLTYKRAIFASEALPGKTYLVAQVAPVAPVAMTQVALQA